MNVFFSWVFGDVSCDLFSNIFSISSLSTCYTLLLMMLNKYIAIAYPLKYRIYVTKPRLQSVLIGVWVLVIMTVGVLAMLNNATHEYSKSLYICTFNFKNIKRLRLHVVLVTNLILMPVFITHIFCNIRIYLIIRKHQKQIMHFSPKHATCCSTTTGVAAIATQPGSTNAPKSTDVCKTRYKGLKTIFLSSGCFFSTWCFHTVANILQLNSVYHLPDWFMFLTVYGSASNSFCNWIIYTCTFRPYRDAQRELMHRCWKKMWCTRK